MNIKVNDKVLTRAEILQAFAALMDAEGRANPDEMMGDTADRLVTEALSI